MLRIVWNGEKCNEIQKKLFLDGIVFWYWIVSFLVLNILGIVNKNNPIMLRSLVTGNEELDYVKLHTSYRVCDNMVPHPPCISIYSYTIKQHRKTLLSL